MDATTLTRLLAMLLPADVVEYVNKHALRPDAPLQIYLSQARTQATRAAEKAYPYVQPRVERLVSAMSSAAEASPAAGQLGSVLVPLAILTCSVLVLNWIRRMVMWWTRLAFRAVLWATVIALGAWAWNRGVESSIRDVVVLGGKIAGYLAVVKDIWIEEYNRYEGQQTMGRAKARGSTR